MRRGIGIDLLDPALHASGEVMDVFRRLRAEAPVAWCEGRRGPGYWSITGHPELIEAARDAETFSSWWGTRPEVVRPDHLARPLHNLDPPDHTALRAIAARAVGADRLDALDPAFDRVVATVVSAVRERARGDLVRDVAEPIAARVFAAWLGIEDALAGELLACVTAVHEAGAALLDTMRTDPALADRQRAARTATERMAAFMRSAIERTAPDSVLAELRGRLAPDAATRLAALFVEAGMPTIIDAIASGAVALLQHPVQITPSELPVAIEELLRHASPIAQFARRARRATTLAGVRIEAGEQVVLWFASANRDERVFSNPDALVLTRSPNPHVAFGIGPHRCLGGALGRRILRSVLAAVIELAAQGFMLAGSLERRASSYLRGYLRAPIARR